MARRAPSKSASDKPTGLPLGPGCRVVLLKGKEIFLRSQHTSVLKEKLTEAMGDVDTFQFDGEKDEAADILDECRSFGLMSAHKLVIVDNAEAFVKDANRPLVERYVQQPCEDATLVLRCERWYKSKLDGMIEAVGAIVPCDEPDEPTAVKWARLRANKRHNADLEPRAAQLLVHRYGPDLGRLASEVAKLAVAAGADGEPEGDDAPVVIGEALVLEMCAGSREIDPWTVQEPMLSRSAEHAIGSIRAVLDSAPRDAHVPVAMACAQLAANLHAIAGAKNPAEAGKPRRLYGWRLSPIADAAKRADPVALRRLLRDALETDAKGKSGAGRPETNLEVLAVRFAQTLR